MDSNCDACNFLKKPQHQVLTTNSWAVGIGNNQAYFGRAYVTLRSHKGSLSELSDDDWQEFKEIVCQLEPAYKDAFGAVPLNWGCFMNHAFRTEPSNPHVHWHIFPRYKVAPILDCVTYDDPLYGNFYDDNAERLVSDEVVEQIVEKLKAHLS